MRVVDLVAHRLAQPLRVLGTRPLQARDLARDLHRAHARERLARPREQVPHEQRRVAHHVVEHTAALQIALPEPRRVRPAVLLGRAREIRTTRRRGAARPEERASRLDVRREELILEIARASVRRARRARARASLRRRCAPSGFSHAMPSERALPRLDRARRSPRRSRCARDSDRRSRSRRCGIGDHLRDRRRTRLARADVEIARERRDALGALRVAGSRRRGRRHRARRRTIVHGSG